MAHGPAGHIVRLMLPVTISLTVADSLQTQTAATVALTQHNVLTGVAASGQTQTAATVALSTGGAVALTGVANSSQTQTAATVALTQHNVLTGVANSSQAQTTATIPVSSGLFPTTTTSRYFLDQNGNPWLGVGDTAWSIVGSLSDADIVTYLDNRALKGVNLVLASTPEPWYVANPPQNVDGVLPFTGTAFQSTLTPAYWARVDLFVSLAKSRGITVLLCPFYLGYPNTSSPSDAAATDGWAAAVVAATNAQMRTYAGYLHARYGSAPNVMWLIGHDRVPGTTLLARVAAFVDELQNVLGNTQLLGYGGAHPIDLAGTDTWGYGSADWSTTATSYPPDFDTQYDYSEQNAVNAYTMWSNSPTRPFILFESVYEQEQGRPAGGTLPIGDMLLREEMWAPFAAGATGIIFGNNPIWNFENRWYTPYTGTWQTNMDVAGSGYLAQFAAITHTISGWETTVADTGSTFCTTQGTGTNRVAARFSGDLGIVYHPAFSSGTISLDYTEFATKWATVITSRIDPANGAVTVIDASEATTNSAFSISAPAANSAGTRDWLFVVNGLTLKTANALFAGTVAPTALYVGTTAVSKLYAGTTQVWP